MLKLIQCEFQKLKRKKFILLTIAAAFLFPIPLTILMATHMQSFDQLFRANVFFGDLLLLPCILGVIAAILFFTERENDTLKNYLTIPVSKAKMMFAKLCVLLFFAVLYSVTGLGATLIGGAFIGQLDHVFNRLLLSVALGIFVMAGTLPVILIAAVTRRNSLFAILLSIIYATVSFAIAYAFAGNPEPLNSIASLLPIAIILKWYFGVVPLEPGMAYILPYTLSTPATIGILGIYAVALSSLTVFFYEQIEQ